MIPVLLILIAVLSYGLGALNGPLVLSRFVFHKDLRKHGSGHANYANFVRVFGSKWGPAAIAVDVLKSIIAVLAGGLIMLIVNREGNYVVVGKLFAGFCNMLGAIYPAQNGFRGTKGILPCMVTYWLADWRIGLVATAVYVIVVAFAQYMSLAAMAAAVMGPIAAWIFVAPEHLKGLSGTLALFMALVILWRYRGHIIKLLNKKEPKVKWGRPTSKKMDDDF